MMLSGADLNALISQVVEFSDARDAWTSRHIGQALSYAQWNRLKKAEEWLAEFGRKVKRADAEAAIPGVSAPAGAGPCGGGERHQPESVSVGDPPRELGLVDVSSHTPPDEPTP